jgi:hypothetical protein
LGAALKSICDVFTKFEFCSPGASAYVNTTPFARAFEAPQKLSAPSAAAMIIDFFISTT